MKSHAQIISIFLTTTLLTTGLVTKAQSIISTFPAGGGGFFYVGTDAPGNYFGGAVAFTPSENYTLTSASVELSGYTGAHGQIASLSIYSDLSEPNNATLPNQPNELLASGTVAPNNGSEASFTVDFSGEMNLLANDTYWLFVQDTSPNGWKAVNGFTWVGGGNPTGPAVYDGSAAFIVDGFYPSTASPAFSVDDAPANIPEPSQYGFIGEAMLIVWMFSGWRRSRVQTRLT
jgi:hypothetical protein